MSVRSLKSAFAAVTGFALLCGSARAEDAVYAQLSSTVSQKPTVTTPTLATVNSNDALAGIVHTVDGKNTDIVIKSPGAYFIVVAAQVGKDKGDGDEFVNLWVRQNGKDVDNSNTRQHIKEPKFTAVLVCQGIAECKAGDVLQVAYSVSSTDKGLGIIATSPKGEPVIPSVIISVFKIK